MAALRIAHAFGRPDVDRFLSEIDHDQFAEWASYFSLEPVNWQADRLMIRRLSYVIAQSRSSKGLKEAKFEMKLGANLRSEETEKAMFEAMSIRQNITAERDDG